MLTGIALTILLGLGAQHQGHGAEPPVPEGTPPCVVEAMALVKAADERLEAARLTNEPSAMRAALADLQTTLAAIEAELASCGESETER